MFKIILGLAIAASAVLPSTAFAYSLPEAMSTTSTISLGAGEVDLSIPSFVTGTITIDNTRDEDVYVTAGDVAGGKTGYGFMFHENMVYALSHTGATEWRMPAAFVKEGQTVTVCMAHIPGVGLRFGTWADKQYSRGILQDFLPTIGERFSSAFNVFAKARSGEVNVVVGSWGYTPKVHNCVTPK